MRKRVKKGPLSVHAVAGSYVVMLGIDMTESASEGVLGFAIQRTDHSNKNRRDWLAGFKVFPGTKIEKGALVSTHEQPLQGFLWADMTTRLAHTYTYRVIAMRGKPGALKEAEEVSVRISMEDEDTATHAVYFNRGVAGSQAYARKFGDKTPAQVPNNKAWEWLSRGLAEAIVAFVGQAKGKGFGLRASIYEFQQPDVLNAFKEASKSGADVKIVFDARPNSADTPNKHNREAIKKAGLEAITIPRTQAPSAISHNKFIVLLKRGKPVQVWTGSTNLTQGGIYGHSNVGHCVRDAGVAAKYLDYWEQLSQDPASKDLRAWAEENTPVPKTLPRRNTTTCIFSPRPTLEALEWYTERMDKSPGAVFFTAAFGVNDLFTEVLASHKDYLRYVLLESPAKEMERITKDRLNKVALAATLGSGKFERWMREQTVPDLNGHVKFIHTKYMLIDPLGPDPLVISGSANFSNASTKNNDENMLLVRGDKRVADIYLGEFMRLFNHHYFRMLVKKFNQSDPATGKRGFLAPDDSWRLPYYVEGTPKKLEREYFA